MKMKSEKKREIGPWKIKAFYNFIESLHIFYTELSYTSWLTEYTKYCKVLPDTMDHVEKSQK
jgi:hypothetical protein